MSDIYKTHYEKTIIFMIIGYVLMFIIYKINIRVFVKNSLPLYILGVLSLILVLFFGYNANGASSWFKFGPISIQPSEIFKFFYLIFLSNILSKSKLKGFKLLFLAIIIFIIPGFLIFLEPDTGVACMYAILTLGCLFRSNIKKTKLWLILSILIISIGAFITMYFTKQDLFIKIFGTSFFYRMDRLLAFHKNTSYQLNNALIGIGSSGLYGHGLKSSKIYIPESTTDFVFDLSICNFGLIMGIVLIILYSLYLYKVYKLTINNDKFYQIYASGIFYLSLFQILEHIFMNIGLTPITGITLPFMSYGGSSLISYFMLMGILLKVV